VVKLVTAAARIRSKRCVAIAAMRYETEAYTEGFTLLIGDYMKRATTLWLLLLAFLFVACVGRDGRFGSIFGDPRAVEGTWYLNGDRDKRTEIISTRDGYEARNEHGQASRLEIGLGGNIRARDWENGLRGTVRRDSIEWENGTRWTREPSR
jgi:hypothetical protein